MGKPHQEPLTTSPPRSGGEVGAPRGAPGEGQSLPVERKAREGTNLFGLDRAALRARFAEMGEAPFRADQVMNWIYRRGVDDFAAMSNLGKDLRARLADHFVIQPPELVTEQTSADGTRKWVLRVVDAKRGEGQAIETPRLAEGQAIETVFIPEDDRGTLCISSQVGCAMDCSFCATGAQGFSRNLSAAEIIAQVWFASKTLGGNFQTDRVISNIVFMGMGEPLANYDAVLTALRILLDDHGFGLSKRRVTVSTSGLVPFMDRLRQDVDCALALSLHAPNDALRNELVPINRKYPLDELMAACKRYTEGKDRKAHIVYEYVMLDGVNDAPEHARQLARLLAGLPAKVNLIPFNAFPGTAYRRSPADRIRAFADILKGKDILTTTRKTRGDDIDAACGQLAGKVQSRQKQRLRDIPVKTVAAPSHRRHA
jgi:23S rRNA (adenine2503-C2)-methyltransferase